MRDTFVKTLVELAKNDKKIELVTGDLGFGVLKPFWEQCPNQFTNAGIAEQNMASLCAGMALTGKIVFMYSIGNFPTLRCLEQIRNDCAYHNANVKIVCVGGGFAYGPLGMSHHATEDLAEMMSLPNVAVFAPGDLVEAEEITKAIVDYPGTCYLRLGRGGEKRIHDKINNFQIGKAIKIKDGKDIAIFSTGAIFDEVLKTYYELVKNGFEPTIYTFPTIKPIDHCTIVECAKKHRIIFTVEEHGLLGGFGSVVSSIVASIRGDKAVVKNVGLDNCFCSIVGSQSYLRKETKIDSESLMKTIERELKHEK